jgi:hypothetical protein
MCNHIVLEMLWTQAGSSLITSELKDTGQLGFGFEQIQEEKKAARGYAAISAKRMKRLHDSPTWENYK